MANEFDKMSADQLKAYIKGQEPDPFADMSTDDLKAYIENKPTKEMMGARAPTYEKDLTTLTQKYGSLGTAPFIKGVAGGISEAVGGDSSGEPELFGGLGPALSRFGKGFSQSRKKSQQDEVAAANREPGLDRGMAIGQGLVGAALVPQTSALTLPGRVLQGMKFGAAQGSLQALGHANSIPEALTNVGTNAAIGGGIALGAESLPYAFKGWKKLLNEDRLNPAQKQQLIDALERLNIKPTAGVRTDAPLVRGLESTLEQSPTAGGALVRQETNAMRDGISKAARNIVDESSGLTPNEMARQVKGGMLADIGEKFGPSQMLFDRVAESTKNIAPSQKSLDAVSRNINQIDKVSTMPGSSWANQANQISGWIKGAKTVDDIKQIRSQVGALYRQASEGGGPETPVLGEIYSKLTKLEENNLVRSGIAQAKGAAGGKQEVLDLLKELKTAKKSYRAESESLRELANDLGAPGWASKDKGMFTKWLDNIQNEKVMGNLFDSGNLEALQSLQSKFPKQFEILRRSKIEEIAAKSVVGNNLSETALLRNVKDMGPEVRQLIFGGKAKNLEDLKTVIASLPPKAGPSGTPQGESLKMSWSPLEQAGSMANYGLYKLSTNPAARGVVDKVLTVGEKMSPGPRMQRFLSIEGSNETNNALERRRERMRKIGSR